MITAKNKDILGYNMKLLKRGGGGEGGGVNVYWVIFSWWRD